MYKTKSKHHDNNYTLSDMKLQTNDINSHDTNTKIQDAITCIQDNSN